MKSYLPLSLAILLLAANSSALMAEEKAEGGSKMSIEAVVENCEKQYSEDKYPDPDERNKMIDQCIDENSGSQPAAAD